MCQAAIPAQLNCFEERFTCGKPNPRVGRDGIPRPVVNRPSGGQPPRRFATCPTCTAGCGIVSAGRSSGTQHVGQSNQFLRRRLPAEQHGKSARLSGDTVDRLNRYFDASAFTQPAPFTFGNVARTLPDARAPGTVNFDFSVQEHANFDFSVQEHAVHRTAESPIPGRVFQRAQQQEFRRAGHEPGEQHIRGDQLGLRCAGVSVGDEADFLSR